MHTAKLFLSTLDSLATSIIVIGSSKKRDALEFTIKETGHLIDHGEEGVGYELLCTNLYEDQIELSSQLYQNIADFGVELGVDSLYCLPLKEMIKDGD